MKHAEEMGPLPKVGAAPPPPLHEEPERKYTPAVLEATRAGLEKGLKAFSGWMFAFGLQVGGTALHNRANRLSAETMIFAEQHEGVMTAVKWFVDIMASGELAELAGEVAIGVGTDVGLVRPDKLVGIGPVRIPGFMLMQPLTRDIAEVEAIHRTFDEQIAAAAARAAQNGSPAPQPAGA